MLMPVIWLDAHSSCCCITTAITAGERHVLHVQEAQRVDMHMMNLVAVGPLYMQRAELMFTWLFLDQEEEAIE